MQNFAGVMIDITGRKEIEDELRMSRAEANARFRELQALYRNAPVGLALLDRDFRYMRVNEFLAELNGMTSDQMLGQGIFDILPDIRIREPYMRQVLITGVPVRDVEVEAATPRDPHVKMAFKMHYYPLQDERGVVVGVGVVAEDVTAQRRAEKPRELFSRELQPPHQEPVHGHFGHHCPLGPRRQRPVPPSPAGAGPHPGPGPGSRSRAPVGVGPRRDASRLRSRACCGCSLRPTPRTAGARSAS